MPLSAKEIQFYTHSATGSVTYNDEGELIGIPGAGRRAIDVEIVRWLLKDTQKPNNIKNYPFKRALRKLEQEHNIALFNVIKTADRSQRMQWVGPLQSHESFFYELIDNPTNIESIEDAKSVVAICVLSSNVDHTTLTESGFKNLVVANSYEQCANLLIKGRVQLITSGSSPGFAQKAEYISKIKRTSVNIAAREGYIALSKSVSSETVQALQNSLEKLKASSDFQTIFDTYSRP